jgi:hypothetical protein
MVPRAALIDHDTIRDAIMTVGEDTRVTGERQQP